MVNRFLRAKQKYIARERTKQLIRLAEKVFSKYPERAHHYIILARKVSMKARVRISPELKRKFCKHCYKFLKPGLNCRVRTKNDKVIYYCLECKKHMRFPLLKEKKAKKKKT